ncbi:type II toxin-antitoxin system RelE/ParE family toxin [Piscinibacter terrae]|uniref:type II toxin-antitoxin system RelE/ParE family toxin n=1 Tax=Piscinibacter terrae TaxID=2496871 RepID=UPI00138753B1|nr:type II toxin-antitoxin system RelE/ParE family toxin [Albitalea terrae]
MRLVWTRRALADLTRIADRIAADKPAAVAPFVNELRERVQRLQSFPLLGRAGIHDDTRELVVHRNYLVTYRVRATEVQILQVWHVARQR